MKLKELRLGHTFRLVLPLQEDTKKRLDSLRMDSKQTFDFYQLDDGAPFSGHLAARPGSCLVMGQRYSYDMVEDGKTFPMFISKSIGLPEDTEVEIVSF